MKGDFNIGDRVKHWRNGQMGTVVKLGMSRTLSSGQVYGGLVGVKFDDRTAICRQGPKTLLLIRRAATQPTAPPTGSDMVLLKNRKWETSYTKKVVDELEKAHPISIPGDVAAELLRQYHRDLHLPYEQRDKALARVKELAAANKYLLAEIADMRASLPFKVRAGMRHGVVWVAPPGGVNTHTDICDAPPKQQDARRQEFMACGHYPNALSNYFEHRLHCEFCCEKEPLKWHDNGRHREPGK